MTNQQLAELLFTMDPDAEVLMENGQFDHSEINSVITLSDGKLLLTSEK